MGVRTYRQISVPQEVSPRSRDFHEEYLIDLDDPNTSVSTIESQPWYPVRFQRHPLFLQYYMIKATLGQDKDIPNVRTLNIHWSTVIPDAFVRNGRPVYDDDPTKRPIRVHSSYWIHQKTHTMAYGIAVGQDAAAPNLPQYDVKNGPPKPKKKVTTTAGEPIFCQDEDECRVFHCRKNVAQVPAFMGKGRQFLNSDTVKFQGLTFSPLELKMCHIRLSIPMFEHGMMYYVMEWDFMVAPDTDGWCVKKRNAGFHEKDYQQVIIPPVSQGAKPTIKNVPYLKLIRIGPPENSQPASQAVLLTPTGRAYRSPGAGQAADTPQDQRTGPIMTVQGANQGGIGLTDDDWAKSELKIYTKLAIPFNKFVHLA